MDETLRDGQVVDAKQHYEVRVRVNSHEEELTAYLQFRDQTKDQKSCEFRIEHTMNGDKEGYWDIVKCWTQSVQ